MDKKHVKVKYCLLGYGYASLIAYQKLLEKNDHSDILILRDEKADPIFTIDHEGISFSPLPIFPVQESELYNSSLFYDAPKQKPISVSFSELANFEHNPNEVKEGSLASFMIAKQGVDRNLCLGLKQWSRSMLSQPLSQVQDKIRRHYISNNGNTRVGYVDGKSLFKYTIDKLQPEILNFSKLQKIVVETKEIHTADHIIAYDHLVSTIPLHYLLQYCGLPQDHNTESASAYFKFFTYSKGFKENRIIYDCDLNSDILRLFSVSDTLIMAQIRGDKHGKVSNKKVQDRIQNLIPEIEGLTFARELFSPMGYPLELVTQPNSLKSMAILKENGVIPFGRFGNWEYSDLHELDWSSVV
ncbi:FAD-dependent oxidoreductase [Zobellia roscoffensis]|uniref:hypothetical protein n=1 Tax=Zobellia roscoffensis TaxID=2779508 RepID=UPI00188D7840|nr:hypothetical protein [Zobellia roscoffensis]